jgi:bacteriocin-like protein
MVASGRAKENVIMIAEIKQAEMNELSETELDQITGGTAGPDAVRLIDAILSNFVGTGSEGKGFIGHFLGNGGHYEN